MSNIIHKFSERVGGSSENDNQERQYQQSQSQERAGIQSSMHTTIPPRRFQTGEDMGRDQYDLGRTSGGLGRQGQQYHYQQQSQFSDDEDKYTIAGRGFKDDWKTAESMRLAGYKQGERNL